MLFRSLYASCGRTSVHADLPSKEEETLDPEGSFLLGKMNQNYAPFEGAICQFDIYPSALAAHNYCRYLKKQCREAETYRANLPPLLPLLFHDPNFTVTPVAPRPLTDASRKALSPGFTLTGEKTRTNLFPTQSSSLLNLSSWSNGGMTPKRGSTSLSLPATPAPSTASPWLEHPLQAEAQTVPAPLGTGGAQTSRHGGPKTGDTGFSLQRQPPQGKSMASPVSTRPPEAQTKPSSTAAPGEMASSHAFTHKRQTAVLPKKPKPKVLGVQHINPTWPSLVTPAATDGFQTFGLEPTQFSLLAGPTGLKGEPGPVVRTWCDI